MSKQFNERETLSNVIASLSPREWEVVQRMRQRPLTEEELATVPPAYEAYLREINQSAARLERATAYLLTQTRSS